MVELSEPEYREVIQRCSFDYMRNHPEMVGDMEIMFEGGLKGFIFKGTNGRWREVLSEDDISIYKARAREFIPTKLLSG